MGAEVPIPSNSQRYVLFLKSPREVYLDEMEGSARQRVDSQLKKFLDGAIPSSAFTPEEKFQHPLRQIKDRGSGIRGLGTWCSGSEYDLYILQAIYLKKDEHSVLSRVNTLAESGAGYLDRFDGISKSHIDTKTTEWEDRDDLLLFEGD